MTGAAARRSIVPILMYHVIAAPPPGTAYPQLWVTPEAFTAQMHALAAAGYHGITLAEAFAAWEHGARIPEHPVVVSFDDGYRSHSTAAAPVLRTLGWPGVLNLEIDNAGRDGISMWRIRQPCATAGRSTRTPSPTRTSRRSGPTRCVPSWPAAAPGSSASSASLPTSSATPRAGTTRRS